MSVTDGHKHDGGKLRPSLFPIAGKRWVLKVLEFGARKYSENGWKRVPDAIERYTEAMLRHCDAVSESLSENGHPFCLDEDYTDANGDLVRGSYLPHLAHIACNALFLLYFKDKENDDQ